MNDIVTKKSFVDHGDGRFRFPGSRDWEDQIVCLAVKCVANTGDGKCFAPSLAKIGEDGKCKNFELKKKKKKNNPNIQGL